MEEEKEEEEGSQTVDTAFMIPSYLMGGKGREREGKGEGYLDLRSFIADNDSMRGENDGAQQRRQTGCGQISPINIIRYAGLSTLPSPISVCFYCDISRSDAYCYYCTAGGSDEVFPPLPPRILLSFPSTQSASSWPISNDPPMMRRSGLNPVEM